MADLLYKSSILSKLQTKKFTMYIIAYNIVSNKNYHIELFSNILKQDLQLEGIEENRSFLNE